MRPYSPEAAQQFESYLDGVFERPGVGDLLIPVSSGRNQWELVAGEVADTAPYFAEFSVALLRRVGSGALYRILATDGEIIMDTAYQAGQHTIKYHEPQSRDLLTDALPYRSVHDSHHAAMTQGLAYLELTHESTVLWAATLDRVQITRPQAAA
ncbi:MAG TPA: hypothetical protein VD735_03135 [Candidatus Saccharimonadales bacterium]|nr:hypothetical protein [Candidatus Saccharimonadales bacterium]